MRRLLCASQSARCIAAYAYSAAGAGESTTDLAWDGQAGIFEIGDSLAETERFSPDPEMAVADVDLGRIRQERMRTNTFGDNGRALTGKHPEFRTVAFAFAAPGEALELRRAVERFPYVPADPAMLRENCYEAYNIQVQGLAQRLNATGLKKLVIGVSGGLDSTQALIVSARVMDRLGTPRANVLAYLRTLSDTPEPLPAVTAQAAPAAPPAKEPAGAAPAQGEQQPAKGQQPPAAEPPKQ